MKRRSFLKKTGATAVSLPILLGGFNIKALGRTSLMQSLMGATDRVLVLVQLNGGNDGLNTLIPLDQYAELTTARQNLLIPANDTLGLTTQTALHPAMSGMKNLYDNGELGVVQSVGYPNPNFSHFRSTDIWTSGSPADQTWPTGWVGRYLEGEYPGYPAGYPNATTPDPLAITIGSTVSSTCQGTAINMSMAVASADSFDQLLTGGTAPTPATPYGDELAFLRQSMLQTNQYLTTLQTAAAAATNLSSLYPVSGENKLADQLKIVARLIAGGLQTRFYIVNMGGFDTHASQVESIDTKTGRHAELLSDVSEAVNAFQDDIKLMSIDHRVVGMTFSEFGRRIVSNDSLGTDHGAAAPLFVFGTKVRPMIHGTNPTIPTNAGPKDNLPMQYDFRSIYGSILEDWFCIPKADVKTLIYDDYQHIPILKDTTAIDDPIADGRLKLDQNFPNPVENWTTISFRTDGGHLQINLFDSRGTSIRTLVDQKLSPGDHEIRLDATDLAAGVYYIRLQQGDHQLMKMMAKV